MFFFCLAGTTWLGHVTQLQSNKHRGGQWTPTGQRMAEGARTNSRYIIDLQLVKKMKRRQNPYGKQI